MSSYRTPGVYVEEISTLPGIISPVDTAVPVFIGYTKLHAANVDETVLDGNTATHPVKIQSMAEYEALFGGPHFKVSISLDSDAAINALTASDSRADLVLGATINTYAVSHIMYYSLKHYFQNGGGPCYIVSVAEYSESLTKVDKELIKKGVQALELEDEPTLIVMPDLAHVSGADFATRNTNYAVAATEALSQCKKLQDRFVIMDLLNGSPGNEQSGFNNAIGTNNLSYGAAYFPWVKSGFSIEGFDPAKVTFSQVLGTDKFDGETLASVLAAIDGQTGEYLHFEKAMNDGFLKAIETKIQEAGANFLIPPSGAVAGIYCATDRNVGVWKAPANVSVSGVSDVEFKFTPSELDGFNVPTDGSGKAINIIRPIQGRGIMLMGARTLDANSLEWRYISVRRLFLFLEESISKALDALVFEANDQSTWLRARGMIENFLNGVWQNGGLQGGNPSQAYFVKVGLNQTMSAQDVLEGRMIVEIGVAAVRPAEFIILKFSHKLQEA